MNTLSKQELWQVLNEQGLVTGELPTDFLPAPWYVRTMQGIAGWIGALFIMGFFGVILDDFLKNEIFELSIGSLLCVLTGFIFRLARHNDFAQQFGLAISFAGQGFFMFGLFEIFNHEDKQLVFFSVFVFQSVLSVLIANSIHRVLTSSVAMMALMLFLHDLGIYGLISGMTALGLALIWINEKYWAVHGSILRPIGYGLALALLQFEVIHLFLGIDFGDWIKAEKTWMMLHAPLIGTLVVAIRFIWVIPELLKKSHIVLDSRTALFALTAALILCLLSFFAKGLVTSLLILLLGFNAQSRVLMGLGLVALLCFLGRYYYLLEFTLLFKSIVLFLTGLVLLSLRFALNKFLYTQNYHA